jgi:APA family basic amino acid/polyamine antiporter
MLNLPAGTWIRFGIWMALGFVIYFLYGARNSRLAVGGRNYSGTAHAEAAAEARKTYDLTQHERTHRK